MDEQDLETIERRLATDTVGVIYWKADCIALLAEVNRLRAGLEAVINCPWAEDGCRYSGSQEWQPDGSLTHERDCPIAVATRALRPR